MKDMSTYHATFIADYPRAERRMLIALAITLAPLVTLAALIAVRIAS